jgi:hypothetical protein
MNLFIAQMVSLVTNYNDYINLVGANPVRWFKYLEKDDCLNLALHFDSKRDKQNESETISPYINGTLYIEAVYKSYSNFWHCKWYKQGESSTYKWNIRYYLPFRFENTVNSIINFTTAAERLREVLNKCMQFTMDNDFLQWSQTCSIAIKVLESTEPQTVFNKSAVINNDRYPLNVRRMIYSTLIAFMRPDENLWTIQYKKEEDKVMLAKLRDEFYEALINGLMAAINLER